MDIFIKFETRIILLLVIVACCACARRPGQEKEQDNHKLKYSTEINKVETITLERTDFHKQVLSNGRIVASKKCALGFRTSGILENVYVKNGQHVSAGQVIARLDATDKALSLNAAKISFEKANVDLMDALVGLGYPAGDTLAVPANVLTMAKIRSGWNSSRNSLKIAERAYEETILKAPFSGRVADLSAKTWDQIGPGFFCTVLDDSEFDIDFPVLESEFSFIKSVSSVRVIPYSWKNDSGVNGIISFVNPSVGKSSQISVRVHIKGRDGLIDGMNAKVILEQEVPDQLVVPKSAVVVRDNLDVLFRYHSGKAEWVYVDILDANGENYSVVANKDRNCVLNAGDSVIVSGNLNLGDDSLVQLK